MAIIACNCCRLTRNVAIVYVKGSFTDEQRIITSLPSISLIVALIIVYKTRVMLIIGMHKRKKMFGIANTFPTFVLNSSLAANSFEFIGSISISGIAISGPFNRECFIKIVLSCAKNEKNSCIKSV